MKSLSKHASEVTHIIEAKDLNFIITASASDGTIKIHTDKSVNDSEIARVIVLQEVTLTTLVYQPEHRQLITGTQNGIVAFWEVETGKFWGQCACFGVEEIVSIAYIRGMEYVIAATSQGKIGIIVAPPSTLRYNKIFEFINYDGEGLRMPVYPLHMVWSQDKMTLLIADDRSWIKMYDLSEKVEELKKNSEQEKSNKEKEVNSAKFTLNLPVLSKGSPPILWSTKAHSDPIKALEYAEAEGIIFTSALDKKVKVWSAANGKYIDALQQKYDGVEPTPVAYKKPGSIGIFATNLVERVDKEFTEKLRREGMQRQSAYHSFGGKTIDNIEEATEKNKLPILKTMDSIKVDGGLDSPVSPQKGGKNEERKQASDQSSASKKHDTVNSSQFAVNDSLRYGSKLGGSALTHAPRDDGHSLETAEMAEEEFDPYYNWRQIDVSRLSQTHSTQWKLNLDFSENREAFNRSVQAVTRFLYI